MIGHTAETHKSTRRKQSDNHDDYHHPVEKIAQLDRFSELWHDKKVLDVFAGKGNLTKHYEKYADVTALTRGTTGDSYKHIHTLRGQGKKYHFIDLDPYGYPDHAFPTVFELLEDEAAIVMTFPIIGVNALNGITEQHYITFWRSDRPTIGDVTGVLTDMAMRNWQLLSLLDVQKIKRIYRLVYRVQRVKATEMTNVRNR